MTDRENLPARKNDGLLKAVIEDNFRDFLRFLYPDADALFDLEREIEFVDKEMPPITPDREQQKGGRVADLLAKVFMRDGTEKRIFVHTEIEGGRRDDFALRMYQYHYRIFDHYQGTPVECIAFFTGNKSQPRPSEYASRVIDTGIRFCYKTYHILDHSEENLLAADNVFALVVLACQKSLREGKMPDEDLGRERLAIARTLLRGNYGRERTVSLLLFLKNMLYVRNPEINRTFDNEVQQFSGGKITMGVVEYLKEQARYEGLEQGMQSGWQKGMEKGRLEERLFLAREMKKARLPADQIALLTKLSAKDVESL